MNEDNVLQFDSARALAVNSLDTPADNAVRAVELAQVNGMEPATILGDLDNVDQSTKRMMTTELVRNNRQLQDYINVHPLNSVMSNDDWGQMDEVSQLASLQAGRYQMPAYRRFAHALAKGIEGGIGKTAEGIGYLAGVEGTQGATKRIGERSGEATKEAVGEFGARELDYWAGNTVGGTVGQMAGGMVAMAPALAAGGAPGAALQMGLIGGATLEEEARAYGADPDTAAWAFTAGFGVNALLGLVQLEGALGVSQALMKGVGGWSLAKAIDVAKGAALFTSVNEATEWANRIAAKTLYNPAAKYEPEENRIMASLLVGGFLKGTFGRVKPYIDEGKDIPYGVDPGIDSLIEKTYSFDKDAFEATYKAVQKAATRERNPDVMAEFLRQHDDAKIGVSGEAIAKLYGGKLPEPNDGLLGWVPDLADQILQAAETGSKVLIPVADWHAKADPEVMKALVDDIQFRPGAPTKAEIALAVDAWHGSGKEFEAFDSQYIGSGEGAQAYGYGHYVAENQEVAKQYKSKLGTQKVPPEAQNILGPKVEGGALYKTRIKREPEEFLDWDQDLVDQPAGRKILAEMDPEFKDILEDYLDTHDQPVLEDLTGAQLHKLLERFATEGDIPGVTRNNENPHFRREASEYIKNFGVPGIRFLDQASRKAFKDPNSMDLREPTRNYVVFNEADLEIIERNGQAVQAVRQTAGLEPAFGLAESKRLGLKAIDKFTYDAQDPGGPRTVNTFDIYDEQGRNVGMVDLTEQDGGKTLYVENIAADWRIGKNAWGPKMVRDLLKQIKEQFPNAETLTGVRVSGAREAAGVDIKSEKAMPVIKLASATEADFLALLNELPDLQGGDWSRYTGSGYEISSYVKPTEALTGAQARVRQAILDEVQRLLPKGMRVETPVAIEATFKGRKQNPQAFHITPDGEASLLHISLSGEDPVGFTRHEAIHELKRGKFFTPEEWTLLRRSALKEKWLEEFEINKRYKGLSVEAKLEEAVAEGYRAWADGRPTPKELHPVFERMKALFDAIKAKLKEILGHEPTWEELFQKVERGEVGSREGGQAKTGAALGYENVPDNLMGIRKDGRGKAFEEQGYSKEQDVKVTFLDTGDTFTDTIKGLNQSHTLERARRNWPGASIEAIGDIRSVIKGTPALGVDEVSSASRVPRPFDRSFGPETQKNYETYLKLIEKRAQEDYEKALARAEKAEAKRQAPEWKAREQEVRAEVVDGFQFKPQIAADEFFRNGDLYGQKVEAPKLGREFLNEEQIAALPRDYLSKDGVSPDEFAGLFGYPSGDVLVYHLAQVHAERTASGLHPLAFKRKLVDGEVQRVMEQRYGRPEDSILEAAKEQALSQTQFQMLHQETMLLAEMAKQEFPIDQTQVRAMAEAGFAKAKAVDQTSDRFLADAGKSARAVEEALLKGDFQEALRQKQRQYLATMYAKKAMELENDRAKLDKRAKRYEGREAPRGVEQEYVNYVQALIKQAGYRQKLTPDEIAASIQFAGTGSLKDFVDYNKKNLAWEPQVAEWILERGAKPLDEMTVAEWYDFRDAIDSLHHIGREVNKIEVAGQKQDMADFRAEVLAHLRERPERSRKDQGQKGRGKWYYRLDASLTRMEEMIKDIDFREEFGPMFKAIMVPMAQSKAKSYDMITDLSNHFRRVKGEYGKAWRKSLDDAIPQDFVYDSYEGRPLEMTRQHLLNIMLYWGTRSNIDKLVRGYATLELRARKAIGPNEVAPKDYVAHFEAKLKGLIDAHARPEDWAWVQEMWAPFKKWKPEIDTVSRNVSGVAPKWVEESKVQTAAGEIEGGYWPVKYDPLGSGINVIKEKQVADSLLEPSYRSITTAQNHLKARTGYVDMVDIHTSVEQAVGVMQQTIHDIAYRDAIIQTAKIFRDKDIRAGIRKHYGVEYEKQLMPWLRRVANQIQDGSGLEWWEKALQYTRINLVAHTLPLNLKVLLSPDIGLPNPKQWAAFQANRTANIKLAMEKSDEIRHMVYNMDRDFREMIERSLKGTGYQALQAEAVRWGFQPTMKVSQQFRMMTFVDQYQKALGEGRTEFEAAKIADSYVRERHGAASVVDLPSIMANNEFVKTMTLFYGYFNTMYNWQRQIKGAVEQRRWSDAAVATLGAVVVGGAFNAAVFNQPKKDESWWKFMGKAMLMQPLGTVPFLREASTFMFEGHSPSNQWSSILKAAGSLYSDLARKADGKPMKAPVKNTANVVGMATGLPLAQIGRTGEFIRDVNTGEQRPKSFWDWYRGIVHGEIRMKK